MRTRSSTPWRSELDFQMLIGAHTPWQPGHNETQEKEACNNSDCLVLQMGLLHNTNSVIFCIWRVSRMVAEKDPPFR